MYNLKINKDQAHVMCQALDLFSRIGCGQFEEILRHPTFQTAALTGDINHADAGGARELLDIAKHMLTGLKPGVSHGITTADEPNRVAYDIYQVINHATTVHHEHLADATPNKRSDQPLPTIEEEE